MEKTARRGSVQELGKLAHNYPDPAVAAGRNQQFNKQSAQVNSHMDGTIFNVPLLAQLIPVINFCALVIPPAAPVRRSTEQLVQVLLSPPPHAFNNGVLSINWVMSAVGASHFECRRVDERFVLTVASELRVHGHELGLPGAYHGWLCGDDITVSATEEGMMLTPDFFEEVWIEK